MYHDYLTVGDGHIQPYADHGYTQCMRIKDNISKHYYGPNAKKRNRRNNKPAFHEPEDPDTNPASSMFTNENTAMMLG